MGVNDMGVRRQYLILVEDDDETRDALAALLRLIGYDVCEARDGVEALECLRRSERLPSVILTDLQMPRMSGLDFLAAASADATLAAIPRIAMSAGEKPSLLGSTVVADFFSKPLDIERLITKLAMLCASSRTGRHDA